MWRGIPFFSQWKFWFDKRAAAVFFMIASASAWETYHEKALTFRAYHEFAKRKRKILANDEKRNERAASVLIYTAFK